MNDDEKSYESKIVKTDSQADIARALGFSEETANEMASNAVKFADAHPTFNIPNDGTKVFGTFATDEIRTGIKTDYGFSSATVIKDDDGISYTFWIRPNSIQARSYFQMRAVLASKQGKLAGTMGSIARLRFAIWKEVITTEKFGEQYATRLVLCPKEESKTGENNERINERETSK